MTYKGWIASPISCIQLEMNRMKTRTYPLARVGDEVKMYRKKGSEKARASIAHPTGAVPNTRFQR